VNRGVDWETLVAVLTLMLLVLLASMVFVMGVSHAASCLSIDVPPGAVVSQYDGDTFEVFTFGSPDRIAIRVQGVDTPERKGKEPGWEAAREFTRQWLAKGPFRIDTCGKHSFERVIAEVIRDGESLASALKRAGLVKP
jgi:endonuclease YncB( thermonuclease family)